jgi:hypothetical protein
MGTIFNSFPEWEQQAVSCYIMRSYSMVSIMIEGLQGRYLSRLRAVWKPEISYIVYKKSRK